MKPISEPKAIRDAERRTRVLVRLGTEWPPPNVDGTVMMIDVEQGGDVDEHITIGPKAARRVAERILALLDAQKADRRGTR